LSDKTPYEEAKNQIPKANRTTLETQLKILEDANKSAKEGDFPATLRINIVILWL